jgi:hypothetical protein
MFMELDDELMEQKIPVRKKIKVVKKEIFGFFWLLKDRKQANIMNAAMANAKP